MCFRDNVDVKIIETMCLWVVNTWKQIEMYDDDDKGGDEREGTSLVILQRTIITIDKFELINQKWKENHQKTIY